MPADVVYMTELRLSFFRCAASLNAFEKRVGELAIKFFGDVEKVLMVGKVVIILENRPRSGAEYDVFLPIKEIWRQNAIAPFGVRIVGSVFRPKYQEAKGRTPPRLKR